jgi:hypothetical protein
MGPLIRRLPEDSQAVTYDILAKEPVFPWNRLLRVFLFMLNPLATSAVGN